LRPAVRFCRGDVGSGDQRASLGWGWSGSGCDGEGGRWRPKLFMDALVSLGCPGQGRRRVSTCVEKFGRSMRANRSACAGIRDNPIQRYRRFGTVAHPNRMLDPLKSACSSQIAARQIVFGRRLARASRSASSRRPSPRFVCPCDYRAPSARSLLLSVGSEKNSNSRCRPNHHQTWKAMERVSHERALRDFLGAAM
jgi:hypothetical protein